MKKFLMLIMLITLFISGCGSDSAPKICKTAGLGDSKQAWIEDHGEPNRDNTNKNSIAPVAFENDKYIVVFLDDKAINITFQSKNNKKDASFNDMLPSDSKLVSSENISDEVLIKTKETYSSETLKNAVKNSDGNFEIYHNYDKKSGNYLHSVVGCEIK